MRYHIIGELDETWDLVFIDADKVSLYAIILTRFCQKLGKTALF